MSRNLKIDFLRAFCMFYITSVFHLTQYLGVEHYLNNNVLGNSFMWSCLGTFSLLSGYLLAKKYCCNTLKDVALFYKKRLLRFYPLFILATICLYLIGFNDIKQSIYGILGLAPFLTHAPSTLWYISMIMLFYLVCPIVLTRDNKKRIIRSILIFLAIVVLSRFIYVDSRFIYNLFAFLVGVCYVNYEDRVLAIKPSSLKMKILFSVLIFSVYLTAFLGLNVIDNSFLYRRIVDLLGILVLIIIANLINPDRFKKTISLLSYLSMSFYLFHRFTYWICLNIYEPQGTVMLLLYLLFIAVPIGICFAYYVQKLYDNIVSKMVNK